MSRIKRRSDKKYDAALVLSNQLNSDGRLSDYCLSRLETALELYKKKKVSVIAVSGFDSKPMENYLLHEKLLPTNAIYSEKHAIETVGNAVFLKYLLAVPNQWEKLAVVSSEFHIGRVREIFDFIFSDYDLSYVPAQHEAKSRDYIHEGESLELFRQTFEGIKPGDDKSILQRLLERHGAYQNPIHQNLIKKIMGDLSVRDFLPKDLAVVAS
jgi:uncharacterized SAM-binding protein YcdF (DUF218 family)